MADNDRTVLKDALVEEEAVRDTINLDLAQVSRAKEGLEHQVTTRDLFQL